MPKKHQVAKGENLLMIAERERFGTNWQAIYFAQENDSLREKRHELTRHFYPKLEAEELIFIPDPPRTKLVAGAKTTLVREHGDFLKRALELHSIYISQYKTHADWVSNRERARELCLAEWTQKLLKGANGSYDDYVDKPELERFFEDQSTTSWLQVMAYTNSCRELVDLLRLKSLKMQLDKLEDQEKANCYAELVSDLFPCRAAREFLLEEFRKLDQGDTKEIITKVFSIANSVNSVIWKLLAAFGPTIVHYKETKALVYIEELIIARASYLTSSQLITSMPLLWRESETSLLYKESLFYKKSVFEVAVLDSEHIKFTDTPDAKLLQGQLAKSFAIINSALAMKAVLTTPDVKNTISAVGSILSVLTEFRAAINKLVGREVFTEFGALRFTLLAGILDIVSSTLEAGERYSYGDTNAAVAYEVAAVGAGILALGEIALFAEGVLAEAAIAAGATSVATGPGAIIAAVGTIILFAASIIASLCTDSEVESWLLNSRFGRDRKSPASVYTKDDKILGTEWTKDYARQLSKLFDIIATVKCSAEFSTVDARKTPAGLLQSMDPRREKHDLRLYIEPSLMLTCSQVLLTVELTWGTPPITRIVLNGYLLKFHPINEELVARPDAVPAAGIEYDARRRVRCLVLDFHSPKVLRPKLGMNGKEDIPYSQANVSIKVDLFGDGRVIYEHKAELRLLDMSELIAPPMGPPLIGQPLSPISN